jgi:pyridoxine/pyridoxamine 5'-phosphate oxidase
VDSPRPSRIRLNSNFGPEPQTTPGEALVWIEVERWLSEATEVWVVTASPNGRPHSVPVDIVWVDGVAVFGAPRLSRRGKNIEANPEVVLHLPATDNVVILEGRAEPLIPGPTLDRFLEVSRARYGAAAWPPERLLGATWCLRPRHVLAWRVGDMRNTATRWSFG